MLLVRRQLRGEYRGEGWNGNCDLQGRRQIGGRQEGKGDGFGLNGNAL